MHATDKDETILHSSPSRKVVRINDDLVIKSGENFNLYKAEALKIIANNTTIPVPKVHDVHYEDGKVTATVMDYIPGKRLDNAWETFNHEQKLAVADQLHSYISQLRELKVDYIGALNRGKAFIGRIAILERGPFDSEQEFNKFVLSDVVKIAPDLLRHYTKHALFDDHVVRTEVKPGTRSKVLLGRRPLLHHIYPWEVGRLRVREYLLKPL